MGTAVKGMTMTDYNGMGKMPDPMPESRKDWNALSVDEKLDLLMYELEQMTMVCVRVTQAHNNLVRLLAGQPEPTIVTPGKYGVN
jgi:hypothetical protein